MLRSGIVLWAVFGIGLSVAGAATYYVDGAMPSDAGTGTSWGSAKKYIRSGISLMSGGDTLLIADGVYNGDSNRISGVPSGSAGSYTRIQAQRDWGVTISGVTTEPTCSITNNYIEVRGVKFKNFQHGKCGVSGSYVKIIRCASDGAGGTSSSFAATGSYILFEECYAWGMGRYPFLVYNPGQYVVFRRCVCRWDYSDVQEPQACFANYDRPNVYFQNCIAIDGKDINHYPGYTYDGIKGFFTPNGANETHFTGCIALNIEGAGYWIEDSPVKNVTLTNCVAWDCKDLGQSSYEGYPAYLFYSRFDDTGGPITVDHATFGVSDLGKGVTFMQPQPNDTIRNCIIYGITLNSGEYALSSGLSYEDYNCFYNNTGGRNVPGSVGSHSLTAVNPLTNSLKYLVRIESGSDLAGKASDGGPIGATILKKTGVSGTLYGEAGWNTATGDNLWPFPNEAEMYADMKAFNMPAGAEGRMRAGTRFSITDPHPAFGHPLPRAGEGM
jgi:hypothetical protein